MLILRPNLKSEGTEGKLLDRDERRNDKVLSIDKDAQINVVVNNPDGDEDTIDLGRVFHNARLMARVYAWVVLLCFVAGLSGSSTTFS